MSAKRSTPEAERALPAELRALRAPLLRWYDANRRDLPWRRTDDPYAIWISEAMLQQTRVETVIPYWERFLDRFPDVGALAGAELDDVYAVWTGLGYYSRARNLKRAAESVVRDHDGALPSEAEALETLPGIGRYTAGAIASIAFDREAPLVDGNVIRVFARLFGIREDSTARPVVEWIWAIAEALVRGPRPGDLNQALMELGATLCTPRGPRCLACPLRRRCNAHAAGDAESLPIKPRKKKATRVRAVAACIERRGRLLVAKRPETGLMAGLWELPGGEIAPGDEAKERLPEVVARRMGLELLEAHYVGQVEHLFTHRRLALEVFRCRVAPGARVRRDGYPAHRWVAPNAALELAHAGPTRKAMALLGLTDERSARAARRRRDDP